MIKAVIFDADDTILNHKECEKQALQYLFDKIGEKYVDKYQDIFRPLDWNLWNDVENKNNIIPVEEYQNIDLKIFSKRLV